MFFPAFAVAVSLFAPDRLLLTYSIKKQFSKLLFPAASQCDDEVSSRNYHKSFSISFS